MGAGLAVVDTVTLPESPDEAVCAATTEHELQVQAGTYENLGETQAKCRQNEITIRHAAELRRQWNRIPAAL